MTWAREVFPEPGGPWKISEPSRSAARRRAQELARPEEVFLPDEVVEVARAEAGRERLGLSGGWRPGYAANRSGEGRDLLMVVRLGGRRFVYPLPAGRAHLVGGGS